MSEIWKDIKDFDGKYQVSNYGNVRHIYKTKPPKILSPYMKHNKLTVKMCGKEYTVARYVYETFKSSIPKGYSIIHKNRLKTDNFINNLECVSKKQLGIKTGASSRRRPVAKIDKDDNMVDFYSSAREAARQNYMSYQTVMDRCNGKVKNQFGLNGYSFVWDDDERTNRKLKREVMNK